jgi:hypothetical protein
MAEGLAIADLATTKEQAATGVDQHSQAGGGSEPEDKNALMLLDQSSGTLHPGPSNTFAQTPHNRDPGAKAQRDAELRACRKRIGALQVLAALCLHRHAHILQLQLSKMKTHVCRLDRVYGEPWKGPEGEVIDVNALDDGSGGQEGEVIDVDAFDDASKGRA